jgi:hypothetical protein
MAAIRLFWKERSMRRNMLNKLLIVLGLLAIVSCKAKKQLVSAPKTADSTAIAKAPVISKDKLNGIKSAQLDFKTFSGKAKAQLTINNSSNNVSLNIRINKGQKIWVSITAIAGIEVARALITPDSILVVNKLQGLYLRKPFSYIYRYASEKLDYSSVEALLVGNAIPQLLNENLLARTDSTGVKLNGALDELVYDMVVGTDMKVKETNLANQAEAQSLQVSNTQPIPVLDRSLFSQIDINSTVGIKKIRISLHYNKADFDKPLEYPFSIPDGYEPAK